MNDGSSLRVLIPGEENTTDVLGVWEPAPGGDGRQAGVGIVWEVDVATPSGVGNALQEPAARVASATRALPAVESRLQRFVRQRPDQIGAFAVPATGWQTPEARLAAWIAPEAQAFSLFGLGDELDQALHQANLFSEQVRRTLGQAALVRSKAGRRTLGHTRVGWTGDVRTAWRPGLRPAEAALHKQAVQLALATSQAWLRIVTLIAASAVQLSLLLPSGIGAINALPAAWQFVTAILDEYEHLRQLQAESARP